MKETVGKFGQLDVLVNNASFQGKDVEKFEDITRERLEFTFHSNILAYFTVAQAAVPHMPKGSAIININSIQGYQPSFGVLDYACTKVLSIIACHTYQWRAFGQSVKSMIIKLPVASAACVHTFEHQACTSFRTGISSLHMANCKAAAAPSRKRP